MAADDFNTRLDRLEMLLSRMATQAPPVINVNVSLGDLLAKKKKQDSGALNSPETQQPDMPEPGGMPRPYVS